MERSIVTKQVLDQLIRAKMSELAVCTGVRPLPIVWKRRNGDGCNWALPGWTGESAAVLACNEMLRLYLQSLRLQFDIPEEA